MKLLTEKYKPANLKEVVGQEKQLKELLKHVKEKTPVIIWGSVGNGKTCSVYALANDIGYEVFEINSSEIRNKENIERIVGNSLKQESLFSKGKIILIDEVDNFSGVKDRGGIQVLAKLISKAKFPVIMTANDPYDKKLNDLKKKCQLIKFDDLKNYDIVNFLSYICSKEGIYAKREVLEDLVKSNRNDLRACINDIQVFVNKKEITLNDLDLLGKRKKEETIFNSLSIVFQEDKGINVLNVFEDVTANLDECFLWIEENIPLEHKGEKLRKAFDYLSRVKVYDGRIKRWQYWRFLVYMNALMTIGINSLKDGNMRFVNYKRSMKPLKIWQANIKNAKKKSIAEKMADKVHTSVKQSIKNFEYYKNFIDKDVSNELELNDDEISWLNNF